MKKDFFEENINNLSLTMLQDPLLKKRHLNNAIKFILKKLTNKSDILSKLKVLDEKKLYKNRTFMSIEEEILYTIFSIKEFMSEENPFYSCLEAIFLQDSLFNSVISWYFSNINYSTKFVRLLVEEILKDKYNNIIDEINKINLEMDILESEEEESNLNDDFISNNEEKSNFSDEIKEEENNVNIEEEENNLNPEEEENLNFLDDFQRNKLKNTLLKNNKGLTDGIHKILNEIFQSSVNSIKSFYTVTFLVKLKDSSSKKIIKNYLKNLEQSQKIQEYFFKGLKKNKKLIYFFSLIYKKIPNFDWLTFFSVMKEGKVNEMEYVFGHKIPIDVLKQCPFIDIVKNQVKFMDVDDLYLMQDCKDKRVRNAIRTRLFHLDKNK